jgi:hypothetical protein
MDTAFLLAGLVKEYAPPNECNLALYSVKEYAPQNECNLALYCEEMKTRVRLIRKDTSAPYFIAETKEGEDFKEIASFRKSADVAHLFQIAVRHRMYNRTYRAIQLIRLNSPSLEVISAYQINLESDGRVLEKIMEFLRIMLAAM